MKNPFRSHILPWFTVGAGILGLMLRIWLFSATDEKGLLPSAHFANYALYILTALVMGVLFLATRSLLPRRMNKKAIRLFHGCSCILGGLGLFLAIALQNFSSTVRLSWLAMLAAPIGILAMFVMALLCFTRRKIHYLLPAAITVALMLNTVTQCQVWGAIPQLQQYFFSLMASIFLMLCAYHKTTSAAKQGNPQLLAFFSQGAVFFCCLSLNTPQWPLYLGMLFWAAAQFFFCIPTRKEA